MKYRKKEGYDELTSSVSIARALLDGHVIVDSGFDTETPYFWRMLQFTGDFGRSSDGASFEVPSCFRFPRLSHGPYYIVEEDKSEGLWKKPTLDDIPFGDFTPQIPLSHLFGDHKQCDAWRRALTTFVELKSLDYCAPASVGSWQNLISCIDGDLKVDSYNHEPESLGCVSPFFQSKACAERATKEIGEDRLVHMFKTFQGVYDE